MTPNRESAIALFALLAAAAGCVGPDHGLEGRRCDATRPCGPDLECRVAATASGNDGNVPANAVDGNLDTRWSVYGIGSWLQLDLGSSQQLCKVAMAWYLGDTRSSLFAIYTSTDATTLTLAKTGDSSGQSVQLEAVPLQATGRYLRVVVNGNTSALNEWASITELQVFAGDPCVQVQPISTCAAPQSP